MRSRWSVMFVLALLAPIFAAAQTEVVRQPSHPFDIVPDKPDLPRVLLIGDSISMGYTWPVRDLMAGKANIHRPTENCGPTSRGVANLDAWLGDGKWDVIHFNFGLHDLKRMEGGVPQVVPDDYEKNLRTIVARLRKTGARLIWANTTPVPLADMRPTRYPEDVIWYNNVAEKVMKQNNIEIDDLYGFALPQLDNIQRPKNVHFRDAGSKVLATKVAETINQALAK